VKIRHSIFRTFLLAVFLLISFDGAAQAAVDFFINGRITNVGADLNGVTVTISGSATGTATTAGSGIYWFYNLPQGGNYTITPSLPNYIFSPPSRTITNLNGNLNDLNFTAVETCSPTPQCRTNGRIAFVRNGDIYTSDQAGADLINLTNNAATDDEPSFSPDGNKIVFVSNRDGNNEIYVMNTLGNNLTRLTTNSVNDTNPSFSPDGSRILFISQRAGPREIYIMIANGTDPVRLTSDGNSKSFPSFSADGSKIVFSQIVTFQGAGIWTMPANGSNHVQLTNPATSTDQYGSFSPDGSTIMFTRFDFGSFLSPIHRINANGSNLVTISTTSNRNYKPSYAPNGRRIIYSILADTTQVRYDVVSKNLDTGEEKFLTANGTNADWQPVRLNTRTPFDYDGDRFADISVFRPSDGVWYLQQSTNGFSAVQFGAAGDIIVPGDYDGDGRTDTAVFRRGDNSTWYILRSSDNSFQAIQWGARNAEQPLLFDTPVPADYDGDEKTDVAVWRKTDNLSEPARFLILQSTNSVGRFQQWGNPADRPVPADFDGDGKADLAVYRGSGIWYILQSTDSGLRSDQFGLASDKAVAADYDGDGRADLAVYRPSAGDWYLINSSNNSFTATHFGIAEDKPAPADYDGDGKADIAVFRPSDGTWYLLRSTTGYTGAQFGTNGDIPTPNAFVR